MTMKKILSTAICCLLLGAGSAYAAGGDNFAMISGYYANEHINEFDTDAKFTPAADVSFDNGWGVQGRVGRWFDDRVAFEAMVEYTRFKADNLPGLDDKFELFNGMGLARIAFLKQPAFTPYFISGLGVMDVYEDISLNGATSSTRHYGMSSRLGLGVDFNVMDNFGINLEGAYTGGIGGIKRVKFFSLGLGAVYHF